MRAAKSIATAVLVLSGMVAASQASAQGFYIGGSVGQSDMDDGNAVPDLITSGTVDGKDTGFKKIQSRIANGVRNAILHDGTRDTGCGLKAFRRDVFLMMPYFDGLHRFLPALVRREGYEIAYVDVTDRPRHSGVSNYGFFDRLWIGIMDLAGVWWLIRRKKPTPVATEVPR